MSVVTTRRSYWPSETPVVFQLAAWFVQVPAPAGERWNWTVATPEPPASAELLVRPIVLRTLAPSAGAVIGAGRVGVVDAHGDRSGGEGVAGDVGGDDAEVVLAVRDAGGVPARGLVRPGAGARGERWNWTVATPEPPSAELLASATRAADVGALSAGFVTEPVGSVLSTRTVIVAEVKELPALSVVTTRRSYWPSAWAVVSQLAAWFVQVPAPIGERWNWTVSRPEPASAELLVSATVLRTLAASAGAVMEPVGLVLSTRTVIVAEVKVLPALSVVTTRRSYWPSACAVVSQLAAWFVQVPAPIGERWNWTVATPEPPASAELLVRPIVPRTLAASAGAVTEPVGFVPSTSQV